MSALLPCPFCGASPHRGQTKAERCQMHGETFQRYRIWCPHGCAEKNEVNEAQAIAAWNTRAGESRIAQLEAALAAILKVEVQGWENIWAGSNRCKDIARAALQNAGGSHGERAKAGQP